MHSEMAQLRQRIDQEIAALHNAKAYAAVARHDTITHHFDRLGVCFEELSEQIGEQAAITFIMEQMEQGA
jgi:hypothetical protein